MEKVTAIAAAVRVHGVCHRVKDRFMAFRATHRFVRIAPTKVRDLATMIRHKSVEEALSLLRFSPRRGARYLENVLRSAVANAQDRGVRNPENYLLVDVRVDEGPRIKRIRPRARGMAYMIIKRMSHLTIAIDATRSDGPKLKKSATPAGTSVA